MSGRVGLVLAFGAMAVSDLLGHWLEVPSMGFYDRTTMLTVYFALGLTALVGAGPCAVELTWRRSPWRR
ncbi:MAG: hypothetical protein R3C56_01940 [Pirellulaceae bacterium]